MALARIFSRYPEHASVLSRQLQECGYKVEISNPDETPATTADLEIEIEVCDPRDIVRRAAELGARIRADIVVAPGVLTAAAGALAPQSAPEPPSHEPEMTAAVEAAPPRAAPVDYAYDEPRPSVPDLPVDTVRAMAAHLGACVARTGSLLSLARGEFHERMERYRAHKAEAEARRKEILLELTRRRLEAGRRAADLEGERRAAALGSVETSAAASSQSSPANAGGRVWRVSTRNAVLAAIACSTTCFMIGVFVASLHARPAAPSSPGAAAQGVAVNARGTPSDIDPKPEPQRPSPMVHKPAGPQPHARRTRRQIVPRNQEITAADVVVRHIAAPKPPPRTQADGWKHFSDIDN